MYVDLPDIFGPVIIKKLSVEQLVYVSFGTKSSTVFSTTGCLPSFIKISNPSSISGITYFDSSETRAKEIKTSISPTFSLFE